MSEAESVTTAGKVDALLDTAETDLNGVSRSMLMADPLLMNESQIVLEKLVQSLSRLKAAAGAAPQTWSPEIRIRLEAFQGKLNRLKALGDAAMAAVELRSVATGGYTTAGAEPLHPETSTVTLHF